MSLGVLNTIIALVVVLLVLSLIVQSVQTLIKKLLKMKSRQFENSLKDLYEQAIAGSDTVLAPFWKRWSIMVGNTFRRLTFRRVKSDAEKFSDGILNEFKAIGRVTFFGRPVLDSLSQGDLLKVMGKLELERFFPEYVDKFKELRQQVTDLREAIERISSSTALRGAVSANVAELRSVLAPIFNDMELIAEDQSGADGQVKTKALFADLLRLKELNIHQLVELLGQAQNAVTEQRQAAATAKDDALVKELDSLSGLLTSAIRLIGGVAEKFDQAVMPLRNKREQVEIWFDTVTQSFDERYTRYMKTWSIVISIVVVILLNANFFRVYQKISDANVQQNVLASVPTVLELAGKTLPTPSPSPSISPSSSPTPSPATSPARGAAGPASATSSPFPSPSPSPSVDVIAATQQTIKDVHKLADTYEGFGFTPLSWQDVQASYKSLVQEKTPKRNADGDIINAAGKVIPLNCQEADKNSTNVMSENSCAPDWRQLEPDEWWADRRSDLFTIFGWGIMAMLLSVGAPFWQDTLESLFGIKNLLRQKSGTQNVETQSGAGQPRE